MRGAMEFKLSKNMTFSFILDPWRKWNMQGLVILSLSLQVFFILFARIRKVDNRIVFLLWLAYLTANWVAAFAVGLISQNQSNLSAGATEVEGALHVFWASFLLLHFGCPDTIGAFSLEDSKLWPQYLVSFIFQFGASIYVFVKICLRDTSLVIPTLLVFFAAFIKNVERLRALYLSNLPRLKEWVLSQHTFSNGRDINLVEELDNLTDGSYDEDQAILAESIVVKHAYYFFQIFRVFFTDLIFTHQQREMSRKYFYKVSALNALRVISVELQFMYEVLHTKALAIRSKWSYTFRFVALTNMVMAFVLFNRLKKHQLPQLDVEITYCLLLGGIALDVMALFMLVFSDWTFAEFKGYNMGSPKLDSFFHKLISTMDDLRKPRFAISQAEPSADVTYVILDTPLIFRRWSEIICASNLFSQSLKEHPKKMYKPVLHTHIIIVVVFNIFRFPFHIVMRIFSLFCQACQTNRYSRNVGLGKSKTVLTVDITYVSKNPFMKNLWILIFKEVRQKSQVANDPTMVKKIYEARGDVFLESRKGDINCDNLLKYVTEDNYDTSVIVWHVATEICYNMEKPFMGSSSRNEEREFSKILSDYMLYLLLNKTILVSTVAGVAQITSAETLCDLCHHISDATMDVEGLCKRLYDAPFESFNSSSPLGEGVNLAKLLESHGERKWEVMSRVWVEMLSYAAIHTKGEAHMQVLGQGGELLAFVWLLMAHFGCLYKPEWGICYEFPDLVFDPHQLPWP